jgi:SsrA-binding protein
VTSAAERARKDENRPVGENRKARFEYEVLETCEAGLALAGSEVKSLRARKVGFVDSYAVARGGELWLLNLNIPEYEPAARANHAPTRPRKLLLHKREIARLTGKVREKGLTLVPLSIYFRRGWAKVKLALVRGRTQYDKRRALRDREARREIARAKRRFR